ncbi:alginate lyase family protein [Granulicella arctica]|uniref:alginate lyase family protein n=1 Tax=Granulicella arctica TaxID=940613 RepID=UPI0021E0B442|nr:alginate lyase family protein [Granulicella arctica]
MTDLPYSPMTRRAFCTGSAVVLAGGHQALMSQPASLYGSVRPNVAAIDHDRILAAADRALKILPAPLSAIPAPKSPGSRQDFYSEAGEASPFTAHRDAVFALSRQVAALAAAFRVTHEERYAAHAVLHLHAWFVDPETQMTPALAYGSVASAVGKADPKPGFEGVLDTVFFAEVAQAIFTLSTSQALSPDEMAGLKGWFASYLQWLTESRQAGLARDQRDHHGSSWLLQAASYARLTGNDAVLSDLRHRFKTATLRAQIVADGSFPRELMTPYPYRNSLFNLDMLTASCELLSTRFESLWEFELQDGPGMHIVMARHFPFMQNRRSWPYRADLTHFDDLPVRNPSLLFAAKAYIRPEYAELWKTLNPDPIVPEIERTFPISQPLLWIDRPRS